MEEQIGRLAMRQEGEFWNAYYARMETIDEAILLGSIKMSLVTNNEPRRLLFMGMMQEAVGEIIQLATGYEVDFKEPTTAPQHEKSGNA